MPANPSFTGTEPGSPRAVKEWWKKENVPLYSQKYGELRKSFVKLAAMIGEFRDKGRSRILTNKGTCQRTQKREGADFGSKERLEGGITRNYGREEKTKRPFEI